MDRSSLDLCLIKEKGNWVQVLYTCISYSFKAYVVEIAIEQVMYSGTCHLMIYQILILFIFHKIQPILGGYFCRKNLKHTNEVLNIIPYVMLDYTLSVYRLKNIMCAYII